MRAGGIIVLVKSNQLVKKISKQNIFRQRKLDLNPFLPPKHYKYGVPFSLLVGFSINLLIVYRESVKLIGYITRRLSADSPQL